MDDLSPLEPHLCPPHATSCPWRDLGLCLRNHKWRSVFTNSQHIYRYTIGKSLVLTLFITWLLNKSLGCLIHNSFQIVVCLTAAELLIAGFWTLETLWALSDDTSATDTGDRTRRDNVLSAGILSQVETWIKTNAKRSKNGFNLICMVICCILAVVTCPDQSGS